MDELLLDTTYVLPVFGIMVDLEKFQTVFPKILNNYSVTYNPISIIEAKWIVLKLAKADIRQRERILQAYRTGLKALQNDGRLKPTVLTTDFIEEICDRLLLRENLKDYFDRVIYATAAHHNFALLTQDEDLFRIAKASRFIKPKEIVKWADLANKLA